MSQKPQPFLSAVAGAVLPAILAGAIEGAVKGVLKSAPTASPDAIAGKVVQELAANPVVVNEVNAEKPYQSRVVVGGSAGVLVSIGTIAIELGTNQFPNYNYAALVPAVMTLGASAYVLFGRLWSGLTPLRWFGS